MKKFMGVAALGAAAVGVAAVGAAAVGGGAYMLSKTAEAKKQDKSPLRLHVRVVRANNLLAMDSGNTSDPYVVIKV
jgi:hypothetical protein